MRMWKLVQRVVIHPRDSQEEAPFAELRYPVLRTSEQDVQGGDAAAGHAVRRHLCRSQKFLQRVRRRTCHWRFVRALQWKKFSAPIPARSWGSSAATTLAGEQPAAPRPNQHWTRAS